jgi:hypothetical protein
MRVLVLLSRAIVLKLARLKILVHRNVSGKELKRIFHDWLRWPTVAKRKNSALSGQTSTASLNVKTAS